MTEAVDFLKALRDGPHNLVAIEPDSGRISAITTTNYEAIADFIERFNGKRNIYYSVNRPRENAGNKKLSKEDIDSVEYLFVDLDPPAGERLEAGALGPAEATDPAFIVSSGNGYNVLWRLDEPVNQQQAEAHARGLVKRFGGDAGVWDTARVLRLPGTTNLPNAKKRATGRTKTKARLVHKDLIASHRPGDLADPIARTDTAKPTNIDIDEARQYLDIESLPKPLASKIERSVIADEQFALHFSGKNPGHDESRSGVSFAIAKDMHRLGFSDQEIANTLHAHPDLYGADWDARKLSRDAGRSQPDHSAFALDQAQIDRILATAPPAHRGNRPKTKLSLIYGDEIKLQTKPNYLIKGVLDRKSNAVLYGKSNTGKSFLALDMSMAIATGAQWAGRKVKQGPVVYFAAEAGRGLGHRVLASHKRYGVTSPGDTPFAYCPQPMNLLHDESAVTAMLETIRGAEEVFGAPVELIVIDTLAKVMSGGNENASEDMTGVADAIARIGFEANCTTLTVHHSGKQQAAGMRGHSSLQASIDTELECVRLGDDGMSGPGVIKPRKQREMTKESGDIGFSLNVVELGEDEEGDKLTTCHPIMETEHGFDAIEEADRAKALESIPEGKALYEALRKVERRVGGMVHGAAWAAQWRIDEAADDCGKLATVMPILEKSIADNCGHLADIFEGSNTYGQKRMKAAIDKLEQLEFIVKVIENKRNIMFRTNEKDA